MEKIHTDEMLKLLSVWTEGYTFDFEIGKDFIKLYRYKGD